MVNWVKLNLKFFKQNKRADKTVGIHFKVAITLRGCACVSGHVTLVVIFYATVHQR